MNTLSSTPLNPSGGELVGKTAIGLIIGVLIAFMIFVVVIAVKLESLVGSGSLLMPLIMLLIAFLCSFLGVAAVAGAYSMFFGSTYYDFSKMFGLLLLANSLLFFLFAIIYISYSSQENVLMLVLAFHISFAVFLSYSLIQFIAQPNFAGSSLIGSMIGFCLSTMIYLLIYKIDSATTGSQTTLYMLMLTPSVLNFTLIPLCQGIWEKIYYGLYDMGNNFFYTPSLSDIVQPVDPAAPVARDLSSVEI